MDELRAELAALRARVEALEAKSGTTLAPFRVVDQAGLTLFSVELADDEDLERSVVLVRLYDRVTGEALVEFSAGESIPNHPIGPIPGGGALLVSPGTEISSGTIVLTGLEDRKTGCADEVMISITRGPHIDLYLGEAGAQPLVAMHARDHEAGIHIARGNSQESDWAERGVYIGTAPNSREPVLTFWNAEVRPVVELSTDTEAHGRLVISDREGTPRLTLPTS